MAFPWLHWSYWWQTYWDTFFVVLLALIDANYKFAVIDVGGHGKSSDGGLFTRSTLGKSLEANALNIPSFKPPPNSEEPAPVVILGDEAFPLKKYLLQPYTRVSARNDESKQIYTRNYRLKRARRVVENAFGVLAQKFRLFYGRIQLSPENADKVVLAVCVLHSYLRNDVNVEDRVIENTDALWYDIFVDCNWVNTRWQWYSTHNQYIGQHK